VASQLTALARTNGSHYTADGEQGLLDTSDLLGGLGSGDFALSSLSGSKGASKVGAVDASGAATPSSFQDALLKAMDGVSQSQNKSDDLLKAVVANPDSVDAQDVTIAMAEANMSLNIARTIMSRVVTAWKDIINTR
jgi:flagellar hook-basal body complex protein FliE